jgi:hypothetical protein
VKSPSCKFFGDSVRLCGSLLGEPQLLPLLIEFDHFEDAQGFAACRTPTSNNSPLSLMVTMTLFGNMASRVQGDVYFTGVHEIIALTNLPLFITCKDLLS